MNSMFCAGTVFVQPESVDSSPAFQELETSRAKSKFKGIAASLNMFYMPFEVFSLAYTGLFVPNCCWKA